MDLEIYLQNLRNSRDEDLTNEWGIYDNWEIHLKGNYDVINDWIKSCDKYHLAIRGYPEHTTSIYHYAPGTVLFRIKNNLLYDPDLIDYFGDNKTTIQLHPYQENKMENTSYIRALAIVIDELCTEFGINQNIPLVLPGSIGWNYLNPKDLTRMIYHPESSNPHIK